MNLLLLALLYGAGCREEPEKPRATQPRAEAAGGTIRDPVGREPAGRELAGNSGAHVTGGVFNDSPASQPTTDR